LVVAGASAYGFLVIAARALGPAEYAPLSVLWALALLAGPGFFLPLEQEVASAMAARRARGEGGGPVFRKAATLGLGLLAALVVLGLVASTVLTRQLFSGQWLLLAAWLVSLAGACLAHLARGTLSGQGRFNAYARFIAGESAFRCLLAGALAVAGVSTAGLYGMAVAVGPILALSVALGGQSGLVEPGPPAPWAEVSTALAWLLLGSVMSMALVNAGPLAMELLAGPGENAEAGRFLAGLVVARVPLFLFQAVQAALLPRLSRLAGEGRFGELRESLGRLIVALSAIAVLGVAVAGAAGPQVVELLFGSEFRLGARTMALLGAGSGAFMVASAVAQANIALGSHRRMAVAWGAGFVALAGVTTLSSSDLFLRVELGGLAGGVAALVAQLVVLRAASRAGAVLDPDNVVEALVDLRLEP